MHYWECRCAEASRRTRRVSSTDAGWAVETRTSAPVRVLRDERSLASPSHPGLYPSAEGAGYEGGIVSAALDGLKVADGILAGE